MTYHNVANNVQSALATAVAATDTAMTVNDAVFPAVPFYATINKTEVVEVTAISATNTKSWTTVNRGQDGTTASTWAVGTLVEVDVVAAHISEIHIGLTKNYVEPSGNATTDVANIQAALNTKGYTKLAPGQFTLIGTGTQLLQFLGGWLEGSGKGVTSLVVDGSVPTTTNIISMPSYPQLWYPKISDLTITTTATSSPGQYGLYIDFVNVPAGQTPYISGFKMSDVSFGNVGSRSVYLDNPSFADSMAVTTFDNVVAPRGVYMKGVGDSPRFIGGQYFNPSLPAFDITQVSGANGLVIDGANGLSWAGFIKLNNVLYPAILRCDVDHGTSTYTTVAGVAIVDIGATAQVNLAKIEGNNFANVGTVVADNIRLGAYTSNAKVDDNNLPCTGAGYYGLNILAGATGTKVGKNNQFTSQTISDNGTNTVYL